MTTCGYDDMVGMNTKNMIIWGLHLMKRVCLFWAFVQVIRSGVWKEMVDKQSLHERLAGQSLCHVEAVQVYGWNAMVKGRVINLLNLKSLILMEMEKVMVGR